MRGKMWFLGGAAVGFVVGARAGRERYDQLVAAARRVWENPTVQEATGVVQEQANRIYSEGKETVSKRLNNSKLRERFGHHDEPDDGLAEPVPGASARDIPASTP